MYTFCMCPGGEVINASSEEGPDGCKRHELFQARSSAFKFSACCNLSYNDYKSTNPLAGIEFQKDIEQKALMQEEEDNKSCSEL